MRLEYDTMKICKKFLRCSSSLYHPIWLIFPGSGHEKIYNITSNGYRYMNASIQYSVEWIQLARMHESKCKNRIE